jgi:acyl carrier protein
LIQTQVRSNLEAGANLPSAQAADDHLTRELARIWQQILGVDRIDIDQNYFDLGGDSSLAVQMFARIEDVFGIKLPLATLYEAPTIGELGGVLRSEISNSRWSSLVKIQPNGSRPPFFCVHPHGGNVLVYRELSRQLGDDQPFFGLQSRGLDGSEEPLTKIEDMAESYVSEIRRVQPHGPYFLGGYCLGGAVAYEMACQLKTAGEEVALLALFDTMQFSKFAPPTLLQTSYYNLQRLFFHISNLVRINSKDRARFVLEKFRGMQVRMPVWLAGLKEKAGNKSSENGTVSVPRALSRIWKANLDAHLNYEARPYAGSVVDIRPNTQYRLFRDSSCKWERLARGGQTVIVLPVNPPAMLSDSFVTHLAQALRKCIDDALVAGSHPATHGVRTLG